LQFQQAVAQARTAYEQSVRDVLNALGAREEDVEAPPPGQITAQAAVSAAESPTLTASLIEGEGLTEGVFAEGAPSENDLAGPTPAPAPDPQVPESLRASPLEITYQFDDRPILQSLSELRRSALADRPDVIAARRLVEANESAVSLARAQRTRDMDFAWE